MRVYCAGPMRGIDHFNFPSFDAAAAYLRALGHDVVNPADLDRAQGFDGTRDVTDAERRDMLRRDVWELAACDAIALLPGWEKSPGARFERQVSEETGITVYHVVPWVSFQREAPTLLVGLAGTAQSGKDTSGQRLVERWGFTRIGFADALKNVARSAMPQLDLHVRGEGWEGAKRDPAVRLLLQHLGVAVREHVDPDAWVKAALRHVKPGGRFVLTDVRFPNEHAAIKAMGGYVVRVERPGVGPINGHISETALDGFTFDAVLRNNGTIDELWARVDLMVRTLP